MRGRLLRVEDAAGLPAPIPGYVHPADFDRGRVVVQLWINAKWHAAILKSGATLQDSADEAFALLMAKRRGKSR